MNGNPSTGQLDSTSHLLGLRPKTDYPISTGFLLPSSVLSWLLWTLLVVESIFRPIAIITGIADSVVQGALGLAGFIATVPVSYLVYLIVNRRNLHFRRSQLLLSQETIQLRTSVGLTETNRLFMLNSAERDLWVTSLQEKERSAYLWSLLSLIPYFGGVFLVYALYKVGSDFRSHEQRELATFQGLRQTLLPAASPPTPVYVPPGPYGWRPPSSFHDSIGYLFASILTAGLFSIYWLSIAMNEPALHFQSQSRMEDEINAMILSQSRPGSSQQSSTSPSPPSS